MRPPVGAGSCDPIIVRLFEALERPRPGFESGRVGGLSKRIWPVWMARFRFNHCAASEMPTGILAVLTQNDELPRSAKILPGFCQNERPMKRRRSRLGSCPVWCAETILV